MKSVKLLPRLPNLNPHAGRFVRTVKESCLERMVLFGEGSLRTAIHNFVARHHTERNHQGLANRIITPQTGHSGKAGVLRRRQRLDGMLNHYYRAAARMRETSAGCRHAVTAHLRTPKANRSGIESFEMRIKRRCILPGPKFVRGLSRSPANWPRAANVLFSGSSAEFVGQRSSTGRLEALFRDS